MRKKRLLQSRKSGLLEKNCLVSNQKSWLHWQMNGECMLRLKFQMSGSRTKMERLRVDHFWSKVLQVRTPHGSQKFSVLTKVVKCALTLSHGNVDNERSLSANKKTLTKDRTNLSLVTLNGLRTTEDAIKSIDGLSHVEITKKMSSIKGAHKAYSEHVEMEKKEVKKKQGASAAEVQRQKKKQEEEVRNLEQLKSESENLNAREANAENLLQSASNFWMMATRGWKRVLLRMI